MNSVKFVRLEEFLDNKKHSLTLPMEPQGLLFAEVIIICFIIIYLFNYFLEKKSLTLPMKPPGLLFAEVVIIY